ncbi:hypothetical protein BDC45DRAFT_142600 [Circinella umbellata]|nr:hypothetical protein BDC45DRAFT_142600 [Circinella umbellata]
MRKAYTTIFIASLTILVLCSSALVWGTPIVNQLEKRGDTVVDLVDGVLHNIGKATFFTPENASEGGTEGSCGKSESSTSRIVAVNSEQYDPSMCGKKVLIRHGDKETIAEVRDKCPGCKKGSLDLTIIVFEALGELDTGVLDITWCFINTSDCVPKNGNGGDGGKKNENDDETT